MLNQRKEVWTGSISNPTCVRVHSLHCTKSFRKTINRQLVAYTTVDAVRDMTQTLRQLKEYDCNISAAISLCFLYNLILRWKATYGKEDPPVIIGYQKAWQNKSVASNFRYFVAAPVSIFALVLWVWRLFFLCFYFILFLFLFLFLGRLLMLYFSLAAPAICYLFFLHVVLYVFLANKWWWSRAKPRWTYAVYL